MDLSFVLKIAGVGMIVAVVCQILSRLGKDDQSTMVSVGGIIFVLIILVEELGGLIDTVKDVFGI
ncbi:MAG: stage III sporulation protein AC [Clostridia bacterium]|nr:stage III sporulation protein AC [Clostridia bacterium]